MLMMVEATQPDDMEHGVLTLRGVDAAGGVYASKDIKESDRNKSVSTPQTLIRLFVDLMDRLSLDGTNAVDAAATSDSRSQLTLQTATEVGRGYMLQLHRRVGAANARVCTIELTSPEPSSRNSIVQALLYAGHAAARHGFSCMRKDALELTRLHNELTNASAFLDVVRVDRERIEVRTCHA